MDYQIRPATIADVPQILALIKALAKYEKLEHEVVATEKLIRQNGFGENPFFKSLVVENLSGQGETHLGFALYFYNFSTFLGKPGIYLEDLFVLPEYRGLGIGKKLFEELVRIAQNENCGRVEWSVLKWNEPAIQFYKKLGAIAMDGWDTYRISEEKFSALLD